MSGSVTDHDPAAVTVYRAIGPLSDIPASEHVLTITNGDPGLNGRTIVVPFKPNEKRTINLKAWMTLGSNTIDFLGEGLQDARATVLLSDGGNTRASFAVRLQQR